MTETQANGNSSKSTQRELSNEYQHDRVMMVINKFCVIVLWMKVASALEGLACQPTRVRAVKIPGQPLAGWEED